MPTYDLNGLGSSQFEELTQSLLKAVIGAGTITFGAGPDGAREATFRGEAPYPSPSERWGGDWIFQAKFHDPVRVSPDKARGVVLGELDSELDKVVNKYGHPCDNFILITNVPLSSTARTGSHDVIAQKIAPKYRGSVRNVHVWGYDDVCRLLERYPEVRQSYLHLLTPGDLIASLMRGGAAADLDETIRLFLASDFTNDRFANLDQAGEVGDESVPLTRIFIDLDVSLRAGERPVLKSTHSPGVLDEAEWRSFLGGESTSAVRLLLCDQPRRLVLIGGPGQGKSTLGQFLAQIHRGSLLGKLSDVIGDESGFTPLVSRIPLRVVLRDYAQWVAQVRESRESTDGSVELYLAQHVKRTAATDGTITKSDVHSILRGNPCLCIFDGLDEVVDTRLRTDVLSEIRGFLERAELGLRSDMQVIGTSRPTGYLNDFDPASFTHVHLETLSTQKAQAYADKWVGARVTDASRAARIRHAFEESNADPQVSLLLHTPLQVTIILYVILSGDSPPRQRESLFNDYVDVIYRRERAKHRGIIRTEKDVLLGLHDYLGYVIHRRAGDPAHVIAALTSEEFNAEVRAYLKHVNPWKSGEELDQQVRLLVTEAQDRLVLLVEAVPGQFGFELRSLQEYFAATHLVQTSKNSDQRYQRFEAIARSGHWRNVALFFAGQIGRLFRGEAANLVAACRAIDGSSPDVLLRRGCSLALDLSVDRAFGSNQPLQHLVVAEALAILNADPGNWEAGEWQRRLEELPREDIEHHVLPVLESQLGALDVAHQSPALAVLNGLSPAAAPVMQVLRSWIDGPSSADRLLALRRAFEMRLPPEWVHQHAARAIEGASADDLARVLAPMAAQSPVYFAQCMGEVEMSDEIAAHVMASMSRVGFIGGDSRTFAVELLNTDLPDATTDVVRTGLVAVSCIRAFAWSDYSRQLGRNTDELEPLSRTIGAIIPRSARDEDRVATSGVALYRAISSINWDLMSKRCGVETVEALLSLVRDADDSERALALAWEYGAVRVSALRHLLWDANAGALDGAMLRDACEIAAEYSGPDGERRWSEMEHRLSQDMLNLPLRDRVEVVLGNAPRWRRMGRARTAERATGLNRDEISRLLVFARPGSGERGLLPEVLRRIPRLLDSSDRSTRIRALRALSEVMPIEAINDVADDESFAQVLHRLIALAPKERLAGRALKACVLALTTRMRDEPPRLVEMLDALGTAEPAFVYVRVSSGEGAQALQTLGRVLTIAKSGPVRKAAAECIRDLTATSGSPQLADDPTMASELAATVEELLSSDDAAAQAAAVQMLPMLPGAPLETITEPLASLQPEMDDDLTEAWLHALETMTNSLTDSTRLALSQRAQHLLLTNGMTPEMRGALFRFVRRLADADPPDINGSEGELDLPLPPPGEPVSLTKR